MKGEPRIVPTVADLLADPARALELDASEAARLLAAVEGVAGVLRARIAAPSPAPNGDGSGSDEMLTAEQAARRTGMSRRLLYKRAKANELPFAHRLSARRVGFSARGIERWLTRRKGRNGAVEI